jgi:hypothetical protein
MSDKLPNRKKIRFENYENCVSKFARNAYNPYATHMGK